MRTTPSPSLRRNCALFATATLLGGCLTIEENYTFKKDGSGSLEYVVDMSEMMEMMKSFQAMGDEQEKDQKGDGVGEMDMSDEMTELKKIPGVKKVKVKKEKEGYVQRLSFRFADVEALNKALNVLMPDSTGIKSDFFRWEGNTLVRINNRHASEMGDDMSDDSAESDSTLDAGAILQSMKYKYSFIFADAIAQTESAEGVNKEVPGPKQVNLDTDWSVIMHDPKALDLTITLAR